MIAYAYAMEAELAIMDACDEIQDYEAKYGKLEEAWLLKHTECILKPESVKFICDKCDS